MRYADLLVDGGAELGPNTPNLRESAHRAADYYKKRNKIEKGREAEALWAKLTR